MELSIPAEAPQTQKFLRLNEEEFKNLFWL